MNEAERKRMVKTFIIGYYRDNSNEVAEETVRMVEEMLEKLTVYEFGVYLNPQYFDESESEFIKNISDYSMNLVMRTDEESKKQLVTAFIVEYALGHASAHYGKFMLLSVVLNSAPTITEFWRWCEHYFRGVPSKRIPWDNNDIYVNDLNPLIPDNDNSDDNPTSRFITQELNKKLPEFGNKLCEYCKAFIH